MKKQLLTGAKLFALLLCFTAVGCGDPIEVNSIADLEEYMIDEMDDQNIPALSMVIFEREEIRYQNHLGKSSLENNVSLAEGDVFLLASISKVVTATALLQLHEQGEFELDDPVNNYLPFPVNVPGHTKQITFNMLLTHTSGIADGSALDNQYYYGSDSPIALDYFLENYLTPGGIYYDAGDNYYNFSPGSDVEYSNIGNALIAVLVEQISGIDFNSYCKQNIFQPLGMNNTFWRLDEVTGTIVQPYEYFRRDHDKIEHYTFTDYPNGGLRSSTTDMFRLFSALAQKGTYNGTTILQPETVNSMTTFQIPQLDDETGLHLFQLDKGRNLWGHDGGEEGVSTIAVFNPNTQVGVILFSNLGDAYLDDMMIEAYDLGLKF